MIPPRASVRAVVAVLSLSAVLWTAVNVHHYMQSAAIVDTRPDRVVESWRSFARTAGDTLDSIAPHKVVVVVFSDYECPACKQFDEAVRAIAAASPGRIKIRYRHLPLRSHPYAAIAAKAAVCAEAEGRFDPMHRLLFLSSDSLARVHWGRLAVSASIPDSSAFLDCLRSRETIKALDRDYADADRLGTLQTPTVLINSEMYKGLPPDLDRIIQRHLSAVQ